MVNLMRQVKRDGTIRTKWLIKNRVAVVIVVLFSRKRGVKNWRYLLAM